MFVMLTYKDKVLFTKRFIGCLGFKVKVGKFEGMNVLDTQQF